MKRTRKNVFAQADIAALCFGVTRHPLAFPATEVRAAHASQGSSCYRNDTYLCMWAPSYP